MLGCLRGQGRTPARRCAVRCTGCALLALLVEGTSSVLRLRPAPPPRLRGTQLVLTPRYTPPWAKHPPHAHRCPGGRFRRAPRDALTLANPGTRRLHLYADPGLARTPPGLGGDASRRVPLRRGFLALPIHNYTAALSLYMVLSSAVAILESRIVKLRDAAAQAVPAVPADATP